MSLITLKTSIQIASIASKLEFSGAKTAIESIIGRINDISDVSENDALTILETLRVKLKRNEARNKIKVENTLPATEKPKIKGTKKEIIVID